MRQMAIALTFLALGTPSLKAFHGCYGGIGGPHPSFCLARVDERGIVHVRHVTGHVQPPEEMTVMKLNKEGKMVPIPVKVSRHILNQNITSLPSSAVLLYDLSGARKPEADLRALLKEERPVLVFTQQPRPVFLQGFRKDIPVLILPQPVEHPPEGGSIPSGGGPAVQPVPAPPQPRPAPQPLPPVEVPRT